MHSTPFYFGSILEGSFMIPKTFFAASLAAAIEGIYEMETPQPIEPTNTT